MANNIGDTQGALLQTLQPKGAETERSSIAFKDKKIDLLTSTNPSISKQQSAQRLRHLLIDRFPQVPQQKIDDLFDIAAGDISKKSLRDRQIKII
ncbi:hypothetical protein [Shewanella woodyi]|uniref:hypothetical protein n=1 Tax=Shewanella woodyi TaxID=60961 RepID=UPI003748946E